MFTSLSISLSILFAQIWGLLDSLADRRVRAIVIVGFVLLLVFVLMLVPQVAAACSIQGACPCPGC